jgi:hypothetical protein
MHPQRRFCETLSLLSRLSLLVTSAWVVASSAWAQQGARPRSDEEVRGAVVSLLKRMTLEEKIGQLTQVSAAPFLNPPNRDDLIR